MRATIWEAVGIQLPDIPYSAFSLRDLPACPEPFRLINRIPIADNGEPLVDLRETNPELSFAPYCLPYVRSGVAEALRAATRKLPEHLELRISTALRTLHQQAEMYWNNYKWGREAHPEWPESVLRKMTNRFFAPPDAKAPPGHCTGGAVDVGLVNKFTGEGLDVRSPLEGWNGAPTGVKGLSEEASENRRLLCYLMYSTGLSNCRDEFWHWSYGDSAWAVRVGAKTACYGMIEPPPEATRVVGGKIELRPYDEGWPAQFLAIQEVLSSTLKGLFSRIEHVGSTAVPGLVAKPILDIDVVVERPEGLRAVVDALEQFGYEHQGDLGVPGREAFQGKSGDAWKDAPWHSWPGHQVYVCIEGGAELRRHLAFRDHLRENEAAAAAYGSLKTQLALRHPWDSTRYAQLKGPFVVDILREISPALVDQQPTSEGLGSVS